MHSNIYYCACILYIYTHTHTHIIYVCACVCVYKEYTCQCRRHGFDPWVRKIPWRRACNPLQYSRLGKISWTEEPGGLQSMGSPKSQT